MAGPVAQVATALIAGVRAGRETPEVRDAFAKTSCQAAARAAADPCTERSTFGQWPIGGGLGVRIKMGPKLACISRSGLTAPEVRQGTISKPLLCGLQREATDNAQQRVSL